MVGFQACPVDVPAIRPFVGDESVQLAQLLSSRICHDLIGPIGVAAATDDLRDDDNRIDEEALALIAESARTAGARLAFFRFAFGFGQKSQESLSTAALAALVAAALAGNRLRIEWLPSAGNQAGGSQAAATASIPVPVARLLSCLALMATEALPRGGMLSIARTRADAELNFVVRAVGVGARVPSALLEAYSAGSCADLTPRTVVGYYAGQLAAGLNAGIEVAGTQEDGVALRLRIPEPRAFSGMNAAA